LPEAQKRGYCGADTIQFSSTVELRRDSSAQPLPRLSGELLPQAPQPRGGECPMVHARNATMSAAQPLCPRCGSPVDFFGFFWCPLCRVSVEPIKIRPAVAPRHLLSLAGSSETAVVLPRPGTCSPDESTCRRVLRARRAFLFSPVAWQPAPSSPAGLVSRPSGLPFAPGHPPNSLGRALFFTAFLPQQPAPPAPALLPATRAALRPANACRGRAFFLDRS
jgi:hypothetical protein